MNLRAEDAVERLRAVATIKVVPLDGDDVFTTNRKWDAMKERSCLHCENSTPGTRSNKARTWKNSEKPAAGCDLEAVSCVRRNAGNGARDRPRRNLLRLPAHRVSLGDEDRRIAEQITRLLGVNPLAPPDLAQIARDIGIDRGRLTEVLRVLEREHAVVRVASDLYFLSDSIEAVKRLVRGAFEPRRYHSAMFRDRLGITRKHAIPLLEVSRPRGVTVRSGNTRRVKASRSTVS